MDNPFGDLLRRALRGDKEKMEPVGALSVKDLKEWNDIQAKGYQLSAEVEELDARKKLLWAKLKKANPTLRNKDTISIENGLVMATIDDPAPETPKGLPTFPELPDAPGE